MQYIIILYQFAHNVILTFKQRRRFNVMDVVKTLKRRCVRLMKIEISRHIYK